MYLELAKISCDNLNSGNTTDLTLWNSVDFSATRGAAGLV